MKLLLHGIFFITILFLESTQLYAGSKHKPDSLLKNNISGNFIDLPEGRIHYEMAGNDTSKTVLFLSGFSAGYYIWDSTFQYLKDAGFKVIRFDHFGRGYSDRICGSYNKAFYMKEIKDLLEALNIKEQFHIISASMGGALAAECALTNPGKVKSLTFIGPMLYSYNSTIMKRDKMGAFVMNVFYGPLIKRSQMKAFYNKKPFKGWDEQFKVSYGIEGTKYALLQTMRNYFPEHDFNIYKKVNDLKTPVFLMWGKKDKIIEYKNNTVLRDVLDCKFLGVDMVGHLPILEKAGEVNPEIAKFLLQKN